MKSDANLDHIRHSLAHLLAAAVLKTFPDAKLGIGPTIEDGFYYDFLEMSRPTVAIHRNRRGGILLHNFKFKLEFLAAKDVA